MSFLTSIKSAVPAPARNALYLTYHLFRETTHRTRDGFRMIFSPGQQVTFSQFGEDLIVEFAFSRIGISCPSYLDLGASHPIAHNNTYLFYLRGATGICVEPDPFLYKKFTRTRKRDIRLNAGVGIREEASADFYVMSLKELNTFSKEQAQTIEAHGEFKIEKIISVPLLTVNEIIEKHFSSCPDLISLDIEGLDLPVLQTLDFNKYRPKIFCIETSLYTGAIEPIKNEEIISYMKDKDYLVYADTWANTIFVDKRVARSI